jgi:hypothetical protein
MKLDAVYSSEMSDSFQPAWGYSAEDRAHYHHHETPNLKKKWLMVIFKNAV